jgi:uncharacterized coiled-coil DUF342 family protein
MLCTETLGNQEVECVIYFKNGNKSRREIDLLENLREDLRVLENSWKRGKLDRKKVIRHLIEIVDSILDVARYESLDPFEAACVEVKKHLMSAAKGRTDFEERLWSLISELAGLVRESLDEGEIAFAGFEGWRSRWSVEAPSERTAKHDASDKQSSPVLSAHVPTNGTSLHIQEGDEMRDSIRTDPKDLLQKAQEALLSGDGASAKEFALKAAELIARLETEEARKKEKLLRAEFEKAARTESDAEETFKHLKDEMTERDRELAALATRMAEAQASFEERQRTSQEIKEQIDGTEAEIAALKEKHKELLTKYQETLPARDAAQREMTRAKTNLDKLNSEVGMMRETVNDAESQVTRARQKREGLEAELHKQQEKVAVS